MAWSAFDQDQDRQAYNELVERNRLDKLNNKTAIKGRGYGAIVESPLDIPEIREYFKQALAHDLSPYVDSDGLVHIEMV